MKFKLKRTKIFLYSVIIGNTIFGSTICNGQGSSITPLNANEAQTIKTTVTQISQSLNLTKQQENKIFVVERKLAVDIKKIDRTYSNNPAQQREKIRELNDQRNEEYKNILTSEQFEKLKLLMAQEVGQVYSSQPNNDDDENGDENGDGDGNDDDDNEEEEEDDDDRDKRKKKKKGKKSKHDKKKGKKD